MRGTTSRTPGSGSDSDSGEPWQQTDKFAEKRKARKAGKAWKGNIEFIQIKLYS